MGRAPLVPHPPPSASFLAKKLCKPKGDLEKWNNEVFSDVGVEKNRVIFEILRLDLKEDGFGLDDEDCSEMHQRETKRDCPDGRNKMETKIYSTLVGKMGW